MQNPCRYFPGSFDAEDTDTKHVILLSSYRWESCERALGAFKSRGVMNRLPPFWQLESLLHAACRAQGAYIFVNDRANMPLGALAIRDAQIDTVITDFQDAIDFSSYLEKIMMPLPPHWLIVCTPEQETTSLPSVFAETNTRVIREIHSSPGIIRAQ